MDASPLKYSPERVTTSLGVDQEPATQTSFAGDGAIAAASDKQNATTIRMEDTLNFMLRPPPLPLSAPMTEARRESASTM